jgi:pyridoxamine 5'-phosphate oxidase
MTLPLKYFFVFILNNIWFKMFIAYAVNKIGKIGLIQKVQFTMKLKQVRRDYKQAQLNEAEIEENPVNQFELWMKEAISAKISDATAMSLTSIGCDGFPQSRIVLLKDFDASGFTFFSNYNSQKGKAISLNPKVSLHFFWAELERQVRITGSANKTSAEISSKYFHSRPHKSQIAAAISQQSEPIPSRLYLENKFREMENDLKGKNPEYPKTWGGYKVEPIKFEFWQGRENRLHDRIVYENNGNNWQLKRLAP